MRVELDALSGYKIYPGRGRLFVRTDSKAFRFVASKEESLFRQRKNPRKLAWTQIYRRVNKKGVSEEVAKKRSRRTVKVQRGIAGLSLDDIKRKRTQPAEARAAAREAALKAGKDKKKEAEAKKASSKPAAGKTAAPKLSKTQMKAGGKR
ncbi:60S ribosomal protein L24 [Cystobasidiomycetes sp. EMM_F5]